MKILSTLFFCVLVGQPSQTYDLIKLLKLHIGNKDNDKALLLIQEHPEVLNIKDDNGSSGLMLLAYSELVDVFAEAIELKITFSFHEAIVAGKRELVVDYLNQSNFDMVNIHSTDGFTPLSLAAFFNQTEIAKYLLKKGADPNIPATNTSKVNAFHSAIAKENYELCEILLLHGADVNATQMQNVAGLHSAVHRGNLALTKLLVKNGATIGLEMDNGDTALIIAKKEEHKLIEEYLMKELYSR